MQPKLTKEDVKDQLKSIRVASRARDYEVAHALLIHLGGHVDRACPNAERDSRCDASPDHAALL